MQSNELFCKFRHLSQARPQFLVDTRKNYRFRLVLCCNRLSFVEFPATEFCNPAVEVFRQSCTYLRTQCRNGTQDAVCCFRLNTDARYFPE